MVRNQADVMVRNRADVMVRNRADVMVRNRADVMVRNRADVMVQNRADVMVRNRADVMVRNRADVLSCSEWWRTTQQIQNPHFFSPHQVISNPTNSPIQQECLAPRCQLSKLPETLQARCFCTMISKTDTCHHSQAVLSSAHSVCNWIISKVHMPWGKSASPVNSYFVGQRVCLLPAYSLWFWPSQQDGGSNGGELPSGDGEWGEKLFPDRCPALYFVTVICCHIGPSSKVALRRLIPGRIILQTRGLLLIWPTDSHQMEPPQSHRVTSNILPSLISSHLISSHLISLSHCLRERAVLELRRQGLSSTLSSTLSSSLRPSSPPLRRSISPQRSWSPERPFHSTPERRSPKRSVLLHSYTNTHSYTSTHSYTNTYSYTSTHSYTNTHTKHTKWWPGPVSAGGGTERCRHTHSFSQGKRQTLWNHTSIPAK